LAWLGWPERVPRQLMGVGFVGTGARYRGGLAKGAVARVQLRAQGLAGQTLREQGLVRQDLREQGRMRQTLREQGLLRETLVPWQQGLSQGKEQGRAGSLVERW
jgi:hypothetical protein